MVRMHFSFIFEDRELCHAGSILSRPLRFPLTGLILHGPIRLPSKTPEKCCVSLRRAGVLRVISAISLPIAWRLSPDRSKCGLKET